MVEKMRQFAHELSEARSDICLFAILKMDDLVDKWSVVLVSPTLDKADVESKKVFFNDVLSSLREKLTEEEMGEIARLVLYPLDDHLSHNLMKYKKGAVINDEQVNGNYVFKGYILESSGMADSGTCSIG